MNNLMNKVGQKMSAGLGWVREHSEDIGTGLVVVIGTLYVGILGTGLVAMVKDVSKETPQTQTPAEEPVHLKIQSVTYVPDENGQ